VKETVGTTTQDLAMLVCGVPVAFPPNADDPHEFLVRKLKERTEEKPIESSLKKGA